MRNLITYHPYSLAHCLIWHNEAGTSRCELILFVRDLIKILFALVIIGRQQWKQNMFTSLRYVCYNRREYIIIMAI